MKHLLIIFLLFIGSFSIAQTYYTNIISKHNIYTETELSRVNEFCVFNFSTTYITVKLNEQVYSYVVTDIENDYNKNMTTYKTINTKGIVSYFCITKAIIAVNLENSNEMLVFNIHLK